MKKSRILLSVLTCFGLSLSSVFAESPDYFQEINTEVRQFVSTYKELGMTSSQIVNIMNETYKTDEQSYVRVLDTPVTEVDLQEMNEPQTRVSIDGNPPADENEANERYAYINDVLTREYSAEKYSDKQDAYFGYLYASHYIENTAYDRNNPNFANIRAHIISEADIAAFNKFYSYANGVSVMQCFSAFNDTTKTFSSKTDVAKQAARDIVVTAVDDGESNASVILNEMHQCGIVDKSTQIDTFKDLYIGYMSAVGTARTPEQMVEMMYNNINNQDVSLSLINSYATTMFAIASVTPVTSLLVPIVAGVCYFTDTLSKAFSTAALGALYYSGQARKTDRVAIELGLFPRP